MSVKRRPASGSEAVISWRYLYVHFGSKADFSRSSLYPRKVAMDRHGHDVRFVPEAEIGNLKG